MNSLKEIIGTLFTLLLVILWVSGCYHGKKKHKEDFLSDNVFSSFYYGVEQFWHKADSDELNKLVRKGVLFMIIKSDTSNIEEIQEYTKFKDEFLHSVNKLNKDQVNYVKNGLENYIEFITSYEQDIIDGLINYKKSGIIKFEYSSHTNLLVDACFRYGLEKHLKIAKEYFDNYYNSENIGLNLKLYLQEKNIDEIKIYLNNLKSNKIKKLNTNLNELF
jgi:hypothetical protein